LLRGRLKFGYHAGMKKISSVLVAGAGAIGSMVAWQIFRKEPASLSVLAGGDRLERYRRDGFVINGEPCRFSLTDAASGSESDLVIIACKAHHLERVLADLANHIGPDTLILSLLNGISSEGIIARAYGDFRIPYAMIIGTDAGHAGNRTTFSTPGTIFFGEAENGKERGAWTDRIARIAEFFDRVGIAYTVPENMLNRLWYKFMLNVGVNQLTAITRTGYRAIKSRTATAEAMALLDEAMREVIAVAAAEGIALTEDDIQSVHRTMNLLSDGGKTSMCQDVEAGRKTEVELFSGTVLELARKHGIHAPVNETFWRLLKTIEPS
jgi:2-dehydropantoate 2-reductase